MASFWQQWVYRGGFSEKTPVRRRFSEKLEDSSCPIEPMPAGSKMDPPLAKAEPISNGHRASGITQLRRGEATAQQQLQLERGVRIRERNSPADTKVSGEGWVGSALGIRA
ncbi:protein pxr1-like [Pitangus sulphuratus]|nr:protein pxr1-like [Pitangus sulphuratus]